MPFEPDIIVTGPDGYDIELVVEVKLSPHHLDDSARQLKAYMSSVGSPLSLLITPERLWLYRDPSSLRRMWDKNGKAEQPLAGLYDSAPRMKRVTVPSLYS